MVGDNRDHVEPTKLTKVYQKLLLLLLMYLLVMTTNKSFNGVSYETMQWSFIQVYNLAFLHLQPTCRRLKFGFKCINSIFKINCVLYDLSSKLIFIILFKDTQNRCHFLDKCTQFFWNQCLKRTPMLALGTRAKMYFNLLGISYKVGYVSSS